MFSLIACIGKNNEIGKKGKLIFNIKEDMQFFKEKTMNHKVVMGYNTWKSLPNKLKNRENIVVFEENVLDADKTINNLPDYITKNKASKEEIFIIGGGMIYRELLPYAKRLYLTEVESSDEKADTFFPHFDKTKYDRKIIKKGKENDLSYSIIEYIKK